MSAQIDRTDVEQAIEAALEDHDGVDHEIEEIHLSGPGSEYPGEAGGVTVVLDGDPERSLEDVEEAAAAVESVLDDREIDHDRKRESESWSLGDEPDHPRIEIATAALE